MKHRGAPVGSFVRRADWAACLSDYLVAVARRSFRPGRMDCALFAAGAVEAMTGQDPAGAYRGKYADLGAGRDLVRANGFAGPIEIAADLFQEVPPAFGCPGDIAVAPGDGGLSVLGVLQGQNAFFLSVSGLVSVSRLSVERVFKV